jgi:poly-gamma-glutamate synthesis protein (capsule biosynthesis protein)
MKQTGIPLAISVMSISAILLCIIVLARVIGYAPSATVAPIQATSTITSTITVGIGGDIMFDRRERALGEKNGYDSLLKRIAPIFRAADIAVANLEGPITSNQSLTLLANGRMTSSLAFTFATTTAEVLANAGIALVSLANNHTDNFGRSGLEETHHWLDTAGMLWFGDPANDSLSATSTTSSEKIICKNNICIAFVGYNEFEPGFENIIADVRRISGEGYPVIVMPHWGDEYAPIAPDRVREKARELVAAGAFAIIGSHPHVIEDREWIGDVPVIYSLGNLLFDQYFSPAVMMGNIAELTISKDEAGIHIDSIRLYTVSNASQKTRTLELTGPIISGEPIEFTR